MLTSRFRNIVPVVAALIMLCITTNSANPKANPSRALSLHSRREVPQARCEQPHLKNGVARLKQRRKMVRFDCSKGYQLVGSRYAACSNGKWDASVPVCAKRGCPEIDAPADGFFVDEKNGLILSLFCKGTHQVAGNQKTYCDGGMWDRELGTCRETSKKPQTWCDFETEDLCRWSHDDGNDFEWKRYSSFQANTVHTGPKWDCTYKEPSKGHYMLLESTVSFGDERARLISPLYESQESINACFSMHYFLYGAGAGTLNVYVKPFSVNMEIMLTDKNKNNRYLFLHVSGSQRNIWHNVTVDIDQFNESFQIIIEGISNGTHLGDIAIDDVAIFQGTRCAKEEIQMNQNSNETEESGIIFDYNSCQFRCNETKPPNDINQNQSVGLIANCACHPECEDSKICCPDYRSICVYGSDTTLLNVIVNDTESTNFDQNTELARLQTTEITSLYSESVAEAATTAKEILFDVTKVSASMPSAVAKSNSNDHKQLPTVEFIQTTASTAVNHNTRKMIDSTVTPYVEVSSKVNNNDIQQRQFYETSRLGKEFILDGTTVDMIGDSPATSRMTYVGTMDSNILEKEAADPAPLPILVVALSLLSISAFLTGSVFGLKYYYKNCTPERYKKNIALANRRNCREREEFSDVIYLTEQIDFTLQTQQIS